MNWEIWLDDTGKCNEWTLVGADNPAKDAVIASDNAILIDTFRTKTYQQANSYFHKTQDAWYLTA